MKQHLALVALVVADYDEAIAWYTGKLGFTLLEDTPDTRQGPGRRWVVVAPPGTTGTAFLLAGVQRAPAAGDRQPGRWARLPVPAHRRFPARLPRLQKPRRQLRARAERRDVRHGRGLCLYGNRWDLIEPKC